MTVVSTCPPSRGILFPGFMVSEFAGTDVLVMLLQLGALDDLCAAFAVFFLQRTITVVHSPPGLTGLLPGATVLGRAEG